MPSQQNKIQLRTLTPMFLNGSDSRGSPELRAASIRGQLRYWYRAIEGAKTSRLNTIWEKEEAIFGSTNRGSTVSIRVYSPDGEPTTGRVAMLPHKPDERDRKRSEQLAIAVDNRFTISSVTRPGQKPPDGMMNAFRLWLLVGGLGKRSRRMFGALHAKQIDAKTPQEYANVIDGILRSAIPQSEIVALPGPPAFPTLHPTHSRIIVGGRGYSKWNDVYMELFHLLHKPPYSHNPVFGGIKPRRASPLIAQVRLIGGKYYPVLTAMRSASPGFNVDWSVLSQFMADPVWQGITAWGEL